MKIKLILYMIAIISKCIYAEGIQMPSTCNYMQIDGFLYDYQIILADDANNSGNTNQIFTGRPAIGFCFQFGNINFRPNIALNPYNSSTEGSFLIGREYFHKFEIGFYSLLNSNQKTLGSGNNQNETMESNFLLGPYVFIYPNFSDDSLYEIFFKVAYEYDNIQTTVNGSTMLITKRSGINTSMRFLYGMPLNGHLYFTPNIFFIYSYTIDMVGGNLARNVIETQFYPLSFRWEL